MTDEPEDDDEVRDLTFGGDGFLVDVDGYAGPLDLLVDLVQRKKIDVAEISVLSVVEQFLSWIRTALDTRLELAADWLLMAATLAFLKSKLLLPTSREERAQAEATVEDFVARLRRVQAIKAFAESLTQRRRLGHQWHEPADPERKGPGKRLETSLYAMLSAYVHEARATLRPPPAPVRKPHVVFSVDDAIRLVETASRRSPDWTPILDVIPTAPAVDAVHARSRVASTYVASLELTKRGIVEVRQSGDSVSFRAAGRAA